MSAIPANHDQLQADFERAFGNNGTSASNVIAFPRPDHLAAIKTAKQLMEQVPTKTEWELEPLVAPGAITLLVATPKYGKSELALGVAGAIVHGTDFCGQYPRRRGTVIYVTEQDPRTLGPYLERHRLHDSEQFHILTFANMRQAGMTWLEAVAAVRAVAAEMKARLIIFDTFARIAGLRGEAENSAGAIMEATEPLHDARADGPAILITHHCNKSADGVDAIRGSSALAGEADHIILMKKPEGGASDPRVRILHMTGRLGGDLVRTIRFTEEDEWEDVGPGKVTKTDMLREAILALVPDTEATAVTVDDLLTQGLNATRQHLNRILPDLVKDGTIHRTNTTGYKGDPHRYWRDPDLKRNKPPIRNTPLVEGVEDVSNLILDPVVIDSKQPPPPGNPVSNQSEPPTRTRTCPPCGTVLAWGEDCPICRPAAHPLDLETHHAEPDSA
jgi:hypothetical protein